MIEALSFDNVAMQEILDDDLTTTYHCLELELLSLDFKLGHLVHIGQRPRNKV